MNVAVKTYRLAVDAESGTTTSAHPFPNIDAALEAAPYLNRSRCLHGRHPYSHLAEFAGDKLVGMVPLEDLQ